MRAAPIVAANAGEDFGMVRLLVGLLQQAAARRPRLARRLRGVLTLSVSDFPAGASVRFAGGQITVGAEPAANAHLTIEAETAVLARLTSGKLDLGTIRRREVRLKGLARHPLFCLRVGRLMAAAGQGPRPAA